MCRNDIFMTWIRALAICLVALGIAALFLEFIMLGRNNTMGVSFFRELQEMGDLTPRATEVVFRRRWNAVVNAHAVFVVRTVVDGLIIVCALGILMARRSTISARKANDRGTGAPTDP